MWFPSSDELYSKHPDINSEGACRLYPGQYFYTHLKDCNEDHSLLKPSAVEASLFEEVMDVQANHAPPHVMPDSQSHRHRKAGPRQKSLVLFLLAWRRTLLILGYLITCKPVLAWIIALVTDAVPSNTKHAQYRLGGAVLTQLCNNTGCALEVFLVRIEAHIKKWHKLFEQVTSQLMWLQLLTPVQLIPMLYFSLLLKLHSLHLWSPVWGS